MLALILSGDGTVSAEVSTRAQLPLLLAQAANVTSATLGQTTETDTALAMTVLLSGAAIVQVGQTTETDAALAMTVDQPPSLFLNVGMASETDSALAITLAISGDVFVGIGQASETDEAFAISFSRTLIRSHDDRDLALTPHVDRDESMSPVTVE